MKRTATMRKMGIMVLAAVLLMAFAAPAFATGQEEGKKAIVLASFGTSYPSALVAITNICKEVQNAFPDVEVRTAFTSNIIRKIWHERQNDKKFLDENKDIPKEILYVKGPLATIADLQDEGYKTIIVQPSHIYQGEEYTDLSSYVNGLNAIDTIKAEFMPFDKLVLGRPLFGKNGKEYDYHEDLNIAAEAVKADVDLAQKNKAALVYMGHGNDYYCTGAYIQFQQALRKMYPDTSIIVGAVEGFPSLDDVVFGLKHTKMERVVVKPLMIVAGDHATNDMAGDEDDSWKKTFEALGVKVTPVLEGLGQNPDIVKIFIQHIKDVAKDNQIEL